MDTSTENVCFMSRASSDINWLSHTHLNFKTSNQLSISKLGKKTKATFKSKQVSTINYPLHLLHMDLFGPVNIQSMGGKRYTLVIVDEYSRYIWVFFLRAKIFSLPLEPIPISAIHPLDIIPFEPPSSTLVISISSSEESFETSLNEDSYNSSPNSNNEIYRDANLKEVVSHLESTRKKIPPGISDEELKEHELVQKQLENAKMDALAAQQLAEEFVREDPEINADSIRAQQAALKVFEKLRDQRELTAEEADTSWCLEKINKRRRPGKITFVKLNKTRSKKNTPTYVRITVLKENHRDITHSLKTLEDYGLNEWYELLRCLKKSRSQARPQVEKLLGNLFKRVQNLKFNQLPEVQQAALAASTSRPSTSRPSTSGLPYHYAELLILRD
ncbi:hypothetical protein OSB04_019406 [Centaurea solstitialis]|uniref:Uncharacterized protein n=1 Tax=Centaurea solstitialis TaxID=347529 RepID=A0AA38T9T3_9ASTR|nr:hypothetical protein OSB04_019406 [Centaurea solstitialis]